MKGKYLVILLLIITFICAFCKYSKNVQVRELFIDDTEVKELFNTGTGTESELKLDDFKGILVSCENLIVTDKNSVMTQLESLYDILDNIITTYGGEIPVMQGSFNTKIEEIQENYNKFFNSDNNYKTSLINAAISLKSTKLKLYIDKNNSGAHSLVVKQNKNSFQVVDALSPNLLFKKYNIKNVGFIFLDIEGLEIDIILELLQIVDKNIPIYFEFIPEFSSRSKVQKFFKIIADRYNNLIFFKETKSDFFTKSYTNFNELFNLKFKQCDLLIY